MYVGAPTVAPPCWLVRRACETVQVSDLGAVYGLAVRGEIVATDELFDPRDGEWHRAGEISDVAQRIAACEGVERIKSSLPKPRSRTGGTLIHALADMTEKCGQAAAAILGWFLKLVILFIVVYVIVKGLKWIWYL